MISIRCSKNRKCPAVKKLLGDTKSSKFGHCEFFFNLVEGTGTFNTPDGKIHQSAFFQIEADSEKERSQRLKCLRKVFGEERTRVFENIPGANPLVTWGLTPENLMRLSACVSSLHNHSEQIIEMFDPNRKLKPFNPNSDTAEVWSRFACHRFSLSKNKSMSVNDINDNAIGWTEEDINDMGSEENMAGLRHIANQLKKNNDEKLEQAS